jgi:septal ring factor EnvC (AmiA/AmiB activator)
MNKQYKHETRTVALVPKESDQQQTTTQRIEDLEQQIKKIAKSVRKLEVTVDALASAINRINLNK